MKNAKFVIAYALVGVLFFVLMGCAERRAGKLKAPDFEVVCLDGTEYWIRIQGYKGFMAAKIDRKTRLPQACVDNKKVTK